MNGSGVESLQINMKNITANLNATETDHRQKNP